jgi:hypothetical protein
MVKKVLANEQILHIKIKLKLKSEVDGLSNFCMQKELGTVI